MIRHLPCPKCGKPALRRRIERGLLCGECQEDHDVRATKAAGRGKKIEYTSRTARCKMPKCGKTFRLRPDQDPRYTIYCHECRPKIAKITDGVTWLQGLGIEVLPGDGDDAPEGGNDA